MATRQHGRIVILSARWGEVHADLEAAPEHHIAQILGGELHTQPRPALRHSRAASELGAELSWPFGRGRGGPGGWIILDEPGVHLQDDVVVPDLAGWRRERWPAEAETAAATEVAPDWVCEVLSPSTEAIDRGIKMDIYAREGVGHMWLVQPLSQTLEAYRLQDHAWLRLGTWQGNATARIEPFDAIELTLAALWSF